jgi:hypothetical protein
MTVFETDRRNSLSYTNCECSVSLMVMIVIVLRSTRDME